jgi:Flp pilus assembly protein TadG
VGARVCTTSGPRGRRRRGRSSGQALVEFGLIAIPFLLSFFGIIEFGLLMSSVGSFDFAAREAARVGSVLGRTDPNGDQSILNAVTSRVTGAVAAQITEIDIFLSDPVPNPLDYVCYNSIPSTVNPSPNNVTVDDATCVKDVYYFNGTGPAHTLCAGPGPSPYCSWPPDLRNDSLANADYLGVRVLYRYTFVTSFSMFIGTISLGNYSVQRIEPQDYQGSRPVLPRTASHVNVSALSALAVAPPVWKQEDQGGSG